MRSLPRIAALALVALAFVASSPTNALARPTTGARVVKVASRESAKAKQSNKKSEKKRDKKGPRSVGAPNKGRLVGAARLKGSSRLHQRKNAHSWGVPQLVNLLHDAANKVARKYKGSVLFVGDLSARNGGSLDGHNSHQSGRDADVGFYLMNSRGKPVPPKRFVAFDSKGRARDISWASFDDARNWALVEAMLTSKKAELRFLFVSMPLRARLLAYAAKHKVSKDLYLRAASVMMSPPDADLHDDHFHVRIACPENMRDVCVEDSLVRPRDKSSSEASPYP